MTLTAYNDRQELPISIGSYVPYASEMIALARHGQAFRTRELLQRIVTGEQQRIRHEQMAWRLCGAVVGACLGLGDGFQANDVFLGMGMSALAGLSHECLSDDDRRFLENCQSLWAIGPHSPVELMARLGPARSRVLLYAEGWGSPLIFDHHQGARGDYLVPLETAQAVACGFQEPASLAVLQQHYSPGELSELQRQLYPNAAAAIAIQQIAPVTRADALQRDPHAAALLNGTEPVLISAQHQTLFGYRVPIPVHSDF